MGYICSKFVLRKPVTAFLVMLSVVFFGFISIISFKYELMPGISMPMYAVSAVYPGAQPEDVDKLIIKKLEAECNNLQGMKNLQCASMQNVGIVAIQYNYGQNMDKAYNDLKKIVDQVKTNFPSSVKEPNIFEMDVDAVPVIKIAVRNKTTKDIYNYVTNVFVKELEKISEVSKIETSGGEENYIKISLRPEMMARYNLSMDTLSSVIKNADFSLPSGTVNVGDRKLSFTSSVTYDTVKSLKSIPIITGNKRTLYLEDIADVYEAKKEQSEAGRYDGEDCMIVSIIKTNSASTVTLSDNVKSTIKRLTSEDKNLEVTLVSDDADNIRNSIHSVFETMIIAIILSMLVIWLFLGDLKASFIVGTSIPFSILTAFVCMYLNKYTLNVITLSALVLGVGMMVDNSIVVIEACFRAQDEYKAEVKNLNIFCKAALNASRTIGSSVFGSTLTTVVVFAPLGFLSGMSGQFFKPLGFTIVFCMLASYVSAISIVPLTFVLLRPEEKEKSMAGGLVRSMQTAYRNFVPLLLKFKWLTFIISIVLLVVSFLFLKTFKTELVASADQGMIKIGITTKPGLSLEAKDNIYKEFERFVTNDSAVEHYVLSNSASSMSMQGGGGQSLIAYLVDKEKRKESTKQIILRWKKELENVTSSTISIDSYSTSATSNFVLEDAKKHEINLESSDYKSLKEVNDRIVKMLEQRKDCNNITSTLDNAAPLVKAEIDPILAASEGYTPKSVGGILNNTLSGMELYDMVIDGNTLKVKLEYPKDEYDTVEKVSNIKLTSNNGTSTTLKDIAKIGYHDNPQRIFKYNKKYKTTIKTYLNENATDTTETEIDEEIVKPLLTKNISIGTNQLDVILGEEFGALFIAIAVAAFLVFVVMASQFESIKFSFMIMGTVLFSFGGGFFALWLVDLKLSMVVLLGLLMLIGTAVNNGILYVDTVNQFLEDGSELDFSLIEAGAIRLRPILMTTLTTIVSMIPMACAYGNNGEILQGLAIVDIGGLVSSTLMALLFLPVYYKIFAGKKGINKSGLRFTSRQSLFEIGEEIKAKEAKIIEKMKSGDFGG